ncbi:Protein disulfide-isomerase TMX3 [Triplophysa tibetana]|uniref:protein disulfide-isomerase n=1 Tax=Triplophysa tibetana TaxID=1572043 RepID=A0A5A9PED0_9TELE|nr:Protein disulfide-isomerase TMX3 [Triplophysa tibetana]
MIALLALFAVVSGYVEELDEKFMEHRQNELWLVEFYAPWCAYCHTFEPIWYEVGAELKSMGSPVNVGKIDTIAHTSIASEFNIHGYPTIKLPTVRHLSSVQLFQHAMSHHDLFFVYIGGKSLLKAVALDEVPVIAVFKDGTFYLYNEVLDGDLSQWVNRERFPSYFQIDNFSLYQMGELSKLVALAVVDERTPSEESILDYQFGYVTDTEYINGIIMGEIMMPSIIVLNMSVDGYFLPGSKIETTEDVIHFLNSVLRGRVKTLFQTAPAFCCAVCALPVGIVLIIIWGTCTAVPADDVSPVEENTSGTASDGKRAKLSQPDKREKTSGEKKED